MCKGTSSAATRQHVLVVVDGLYLDPPRHAAVFCIDEKTAIQALDRRDRVSPLSPGRVERHGTLSLYAALNVRDRRGSGQDDGSGTRARTSWGFSGKWSRPGNPMKSST